MAKIHDLRSALEHLKTIPGELIETDVPINADAEICGVYRRVGAMGTVQRPTRPGPAMIFNNITGYPGARVAIGLNCSRKRVGHLLDCPPEKLGFLLKDCVANRIAPEMAKPDEVLCQEVVHRAEDPDFDIRKIVPAPRNTPEDAGPYITLGHCYGSDPETGEHDITIHRLCLQDRDTMTFTAAPGRHIEAFRRKWEAQGKAMPISVNIGIDPAIPIACCFEPPTTPLGFDELSIAGALRGEPVKLAQCLTIDQQCVANAEYVLECEILPNVTRRENPDPKSPWSMPEFPGYEGLTYENAAVLKVKAVTTRLNPIMQTCIGPSDEHVNMAGIPTEASILTLTEKALPGFVTNVYSTRSGGGKIMVIMAVNKCRSVDQGKERQAALLAFAAYHELKHVVLVDDDIDIFDTDDVLWALNFRFAADRDLITIPETICHPLDPSQKQLYTGYRRNGLACKAIFDCTIPYELREELFHRAQFLDIDPKPYAPDLFA